MDVGKRVEILFCRRKEQIRELCWRCLSVIAGKAKKTELYIKYRRYFFENPLIIGAI